ncbi:hypothetical protein SAMN05445850_8105 [Paraburkholderia tuberum]|uniref:Uncharacterized protein n=1 Tax=Paraburkholderia tuberum TaxID=157910 RepID=A0A1H1KJ36_9BURK|nr:hypothetical protein SAMN05445850_8105 [Paraburkholderia tuberum]
MIFNVLNSCSGPIRNTDFQSKFWIRAVLDYPRIVLSETA